jgi:hypothetical protein
VLLKAEHKTNDCLQKCLTSAYEARIWLRGHNPGKYDFKVRVGCRWRYVRMPSDEYAQDILLKKIFNGEIKMKRVKYVWETDSWKVV